MTTEESCRKKSAFLCFLHDLVGMGSTFSEPVPDLGDTGYVCIVLRSYDKVRLLHAPKDVEQAVTKIVR